MIVPLARSFIVTQFRNVRRFMLAALVLVVAGAGLVLTSVPAVGLEDEEYIPPPVVAVMDIRFDGVKLTDSVIIALNEYLSSRIAGAKHYTVVPRDQVTRALVEQKVKQQSDCYGSCRVKLGQAVGATKTIQTKVRRIGKACTLVSDLYDLEMETMEKSETVKDLACTEEGLMVGIETVAARLSGGAALPVVTPPVTSASGRGGSGGGFQVTDLPAVPEVKAVRDIGAEGGMGGIDNVDLDALEAYDRVVAIDGDRSTTTADKIRAWEDLGRRFPSYGDKAASRVAEWRQYEVQRAEAERVERLRREAMEADWAKLSRLLKLKVVSDAQKREWTAAYIKAYGSDSAKNPHYGDLVQYTVSVPAGWALIPAGSFLMGSPSTESGRGSDEGPQTRVTISAPFMLKKTEVTQGEWKAVMGSNPSNFGSCGDSCPVENVSWNDAADYCNRLSKKENLEQCYDKSGDSYTFRGVSCRGYRLPTEAEWEYAARAGTTTAIYTGGLTIKGDNNGPELDPIAWYGGNSGVSYSGGYDCSGWSDKQYSSSSCGTHPVGRKRPNAWGLYDMLGNVWEWCSDWYGGYSGGSVTDPTGPSTGSYRVFRGGSWYYNARYVRAANRDGLGPGDRNLILGLRPARSLP